MGNDRNDLTFIDSFSKARHALVVALPTTVTARSSRLQKSLGQWMEDDHCRSL